MNKRALVIGLGASGKSATKFLFKKGYQVIGVDAKAEELCMDSKIISLQQAGLVIYPDSYPLDITNICLVVLSPGVSPLHPLVQKAQQQNIEIIGEAELAFQSISQKAVAITGTNGKTTVTKLTQHILESSGICARDLGNVGTPLTEYFLVDGKNDIVVAELSSYQLETMRTPVFDVGIILNITPDHLDRYSSMEEYAKAKARIQDCIKPGGKLYVHNAVFEDFSHLFHYPVLTFGTKSSSHVELRDLEIYVDQKIACILPISYRERGVHERLNALASWLLCRELGVNMEQFLSHLCTFALPPHRIQFVRSVNGVDYIDDSKGTNIDAVIQAVASMRGPVILIAGGVDKGSSYLPWEKEFRGKVKKIYAIGEAAKKIQNELGLFFNVKIVDSLAKAVEEASLFAQRGDRVLLSPGCSSFDMFRDYAHRGNEFQKYVGLLEERSKK